MEMHCIEIVMEQISTRRAAYIVEQAVHSMLYTLSRNNAAAAAGTQKSKCTEWGLGAGGAGGWGGWGWGLQTGSTSAAGFYSTLRLRPAAPWGRSQRCERS